MAEPRHPLAAVARATEQLTSWATTWAPHLPDLLTESHRLAQAAAGPDDRPALWAAFDASARRDAERILSARPLDQRPRLTRPCAARGPRTSDTSPRSAPQGEGFRAGRAALPEAPTTGAEHLPASAEAAPGRGVGVASLRRSPSRGWTTGPLRRAGQWRGASRTVRAHTAPTRRPQKGRPPPTSAGRSKRYFLLLSSLIRRASLGNFQSAGCRLDPRGAQHSVRANSADARHPPAPVLGWLCDRGGGPVLHELSVAERRDHAESAVTHDGTPVTDVAATVGETVDAARPTSATTGGTERPIPETGAP